MRTVSGVDWGLVSVAGAAALTTRISSGLAAERAGVGVGQQILDQALAGVGGRGLGGRSAYHQGGETEKHDAAPAHRLARRTANVRSAA